MKNIKRLSFLMRNNEKQQQLRLLISHCFTVSRCFSLEKTDVNVFHCQTRAPPIIAYVKILKNSAFSLFDNEKTCKR